jgi:parallel beta-helix repeat protein
MKRKIRYRKIAKETKKILNFYSHKELMSIFFAAVLFFAVVNIKINLAEMGKSGIASLSGTLSLDRIAEDPKIYGVVSGTGTNFSVLDSQYLNISFTSADSVKLSLESIPETVNIRIEPDAPVAYTSVTVGGFSPLTVYHKYEDGYIKHEAFTTDENGEYTYDQDLSGAHRIFIQPRSSTKVISSNGNGGDCPLVGIWDGATKTCTLTKDLAETVQLVTSGLTLDGNGHTITGLGSGSGIYIGPPGKNHIVKNIKVRNFSYGMYMESSDNMLKNTDLSENNTGLRVENASGNTIEANLINSNRNNGIDLFNKGGNTFTGNTIEFNTNSGMSILSSHSNTVRGNSISKNNWGIYNNFANSNVFDGNTINNNTVSAINLIYQSSASNKIINNTIKSNLLGIRLQSAIGNSIYNNFFSNVGNYFFNPEAPINANNFNIALTEGENIVGGNLIGGNYWTNVASNGYSDTCADQNGDGICDVAYSLNNLNIDNFPLAKPDSVPPSTIIEFSGALGENSWYVSDVQVALSASDNAGGSGVAIIEYSFDNINWNIYSSPFIVGADGEIAIYYKSADNAGNKESVKTAEIKIDQTAPGISGAAAALPNSAGWYSSDVAIRFNCSDATSGAVDSFFDVFINIDGFDQSADGKCFDKAGNNSSLKVAGINIDRTPPQISVLRVPEANSRGWNNSSVAVNFSAVDILSGIDGEFSSAVILASEGINQAASAVFKDKAGNIATRSLSGINIDLTPPSIIGQSATLSNINGWYNSNVLIHFNGNDALSGLFNVSQDMVLSGEGANQKATGIAEDMAGNQASFDVSGINIDKTAPLISGAATTAPNGNNWYNHDIEIHFTASDALSGIGELTPDILISQEGENQSVSGKAIDRAGNASTISVSGINIDKTNPTMGGAATATPNSNGWYNSDVIIHYTAFDVLSGIEFLSPDSVLGAEGLEQSVIGAAADKAGNTASFTLNGINIDKTPPNISGKAATPPNSNDWYNTDVAIIFSASDKLSGLSYVTPDTIISSEGVNQSVIGTAVDKAGNSASFTASGINIDKQPPVTQLGLWGARGNDCYSGDADIKFDASDNLSGVANILYKLNNAAWKIYSGLFTLVQDGVYSLQYKSEDNASNAEIANSTGFVIDKTPPEAAIKFDPYSKDIKVYDSETDLEVGYVLLPMTAAEKEKPDENGEKGWSLRKYILKGCGKNSLTLIIKHKKEGKEIKAEIVSMQYGDRPAVQAIKNKIQAGYSEVKEGGAIKELEQKISSSDKKKIFEITAKYNINNKNQTAVTRISEKNTLKQTLTGMAILEIITSDGSLKYDY